MINDAEEEIVKFSSPTQMLDTTTVVQKTLCIQSEQAQQLAQLHI